MRRIVCATAAAVLTVSAAAGCGGGTSAGASKYCGDLKSVQTSFANVQSFSLSQSSFDSLVASLPDLQHEAPGALTGDWATIAQGVNRFGDALTKSGMTLDETAKMENGQMPGMDMSQMEPLMVAAQSIASTPFTRAMTAVQKDAKSDCNLDLGSTG